MAHLTQRRGKSVHVSAAQDYNGGTATAVLPSSPKSPKLSNGNSKFDQSYHDDDGRQSLEDKKRSPLIDYSGDDDHRDAFSEKGLPAYKVWMKPFHRMAARLI